METISMRMSKDEYILLMSYIIRVIEGEKPGLFSKRMFKKVYRHPKFNELVTILNEIRDHDSIIQNEIGGVDRARLGTMEFSSESKENFRAYLVKMKLLIDTFLDN